MSTDLRDLLERHGVTSEPERDREGLRLVADTIAFVGILAFAFLVQLLAS